MGPITYAKHLISGPRLPFTAAYFGSIGLTLFFAMKVRLLPSPHHLVACQCYYLRPSFARRRLAPQLRVERSADGVST